MDEICEASKLKIPTTCDDCQFLGSNGICGYCRFTLNCYDGEKDLIDGKVMKDCPFNYQEENKRLRKELSECEKFRYSVFKRMSDVSNDDLFIGNWTDKPVLLERRKVEINGSRRDR